MLETNRLVIGASMVAAGTLGSIGYIGALAMSGAMETNPLTLGITCAMMPIVGTIIALACEKFGQGGKFLSMSAGVFLAYPGTISLMNIVGAKIYLVQPIAAIAAGTTIMALYSAILGSTVLGGLSLILIANKVPTSSISARIRPYYTMVSTRVEPYYAMARERALRAFETMRT